MGILPLAAPGQDRWTRSLDKTTGKVLLSLTFQFKKYTKDIHTTDHHAVIKYNKDILYVLIWDKLQGILSLKSKVS